MTGKNVYDPVLGELRKQYFTEADIKKIAESVIGTPVQEVISVATYADLEAIENPSTEAIYIVTSNNNLYRYNGSGFIAITGEVIDNTIYVSSLNALLSMTLENASVYRVLHATQSINTYDITLGSYRPGHSAGGWQNQQVRKYYATPLTYDEAYALLMACTDANPIHLYGVPEDIKNTLAGIHNVTVDDTYVGEYTFESYSLSVNQTGEKTLVGRKGWATVANDRWAWENYAMEEALQEIHDELAGKQATLVSGTNIKTINGASILGSGNVLIQQNVMVGTEAERLAFTPWEGLEWHETHINPITGEDHVVRYLYDNGEWTLIESHESSNEHVTVQLSTNGGSDTPVGKSIIVHITGQSEQSMTVDASGTVEFDVPIGSIYTVHFPYVAYCSHMPEVTRTAMLASHTITKVYNYLGNAIRTVVLERSNPDNWEVGGQDAVIDGILGEYGSYVIDEVHKKYAKLSSLDHRQFDDGTAWDGSYGNAFRRLPQVFYEMDTNGDNEPVLKLCAQDINAKSWPESWIGIYKGAVVDGALRSIPGVQTTQSKTMTQFWECAQHLGMNYGLVNYFDHCKLLALHYAKFGKANSEATMGVGLANAGQSYWTHTTGETAALGDGTGQLPYLLTGFYMNKLFGIEDLAGSTWEFRPNIRFENSGSTAVVYDGNIVSNEATGRHFTKLNSASQAYITQMVLGEYCDFVPKAVSGTNATYYCDATWASTSGQLLFVGGGAHNGTLAGLSAATSNNGFSYSLAYVGARLAFRGDISEYELVTGAALAALNQPAE